MSEFLAILWFVMLIVSVLIVFTYVGHATMVQMFPEGRAWWLFPAQLTSLAFFAAMVLINPFWGPMA